MVRIADAKTAERPGSVAATEDADMETSTKLGVKPGNQTENIKLETQLQPEIHPCFNLRCLRSFTSDPLHQPLPLIDLRENRHVRTIEPTGRKNREGAFGWTP